MGGHQLWTLRAARPLSAAVGVVLVSLAAPVVAAESAGDASNKSLNGPDEKSIVIAVGQIDPNDPSLAIVSDQDEQCSLEPIARTAGAEPDLAPSPDAVPTPADPRASSRPVTVLDEADYNDEYADVAATDVDDEVAEQDLDEPIADEPTAIRAASFNGVTPGVSTREDLIVEWGEPAVQNRGRLTYQFDNFPRVEVKLTGGIVAVIRVSLSEAVELDPLVAKLGMSDLRPVSATDDAGRVISTTFPERGVTLLQQPEGQLAFATDDAADALSTPPSSVYEIELAGITAAPFERRAATAAARSYATQIVDLEQALQLDGDRAEARYLLSQAKRATGSAVDAEQLAAEAVELDEANDAYRLQWAKCLKDLARYDAAVEETRKLLDSAETSKLVRAQALNHMGHLAALGSQEVQARAVPLHSKAIELADTLANDADEKVARDANLLLVDAHLAVAGRIALGDWKEKDDTIAQWIARASAIAERLIADGAADEMLRLKVAVAALHVGAKLDPPINPELWIAEAEEAAVILNEQCDDDLATAEVDWQLALAYCCATEIQHRRGEPDAALAYGDHAEQLLVTLTDSREELPDTGYVVGRLYFQIGAVHAVHRDDHKEACRWYDKALEPLLTPTPVTAEASPGQHGDALVSMGVSFWTQGDRDRAYDLTEAGLALIRQGIDEGILDADSLQVPESNLAAMGRVLGKVDLLAPIQPDANQQVAREAPTPKTRSNGQSTGNATDRKPQRRLANRQLNGTQRR
ncbi:MAG: hypothetical protein CMJ58_20030 [Planctomycetaceae bacterium]|nr:hypothetical protein [Planctomycetaceae bacterium]